MTSASASAAALEAAHPEAFDERPHWLRAVDGDTAYDWARRAWDSAAAAPGAWFDHQLADYVIAEWPKWATLTLDRFAGVPFRLLPWQEIVVRMLVGWMSPIELKDPRTHQLVTAHVRLFRQLMLWIPRKNGKSEFLAALGLLFLVMDDVKQGEGYVFASKERQARIVWGRMTAMIANSPMLREEIQVFAKSFYVKQLASRCELLAGSVRGLHGPAPSVILGDEMHEWTSLEIVDTLRQGTGNRLAPIQLYASTAGRKTARVSVGQELYKDSQDIAEGRRVDPTTLVVIFAANDNDDPGDPATWARANPNLGLSPLTSFMQAEYRKALGNPRAMMHFKCYHLGIWAEEAVRWIPLKKWDACASAKDGWKLYAESLKGRRCWLGFDIATRRDITALVLVFPPTADDPKWRVLPRFWIPKDAVEDRVANGAPLDRFIGLGAMETTEGDYTDQTVMGQAIHDAFRDYDVELAGYDPWNAIKLYTDLTRPEGIEPGSPALDSEKFVEVRQGIRTLGEASKRFEELVFQGLLDHGGHPVLRWMAGNVVIHFDRNLNFMPAKDRSHEKIDGIAAIVNALAAANDIDLEDEGEADIVVI